jgi:translation initiation factor eIF-2B subunit epsilon
LSFERINDFYIGALRDVESYATLWPNIGSLYQADIVEEDDIRKWHSLSESKGEGRKSGVETENFNKCWVIGSHMIKQFDAQGSESEEDSDSEVEQKKRMKNPRKQCKGMLR